MKSKTIIATVIYSILILSSCIKDDFIQDFVDSEIRITSAVESLALGESFQFEYTYFNNVGQQESADAIWTSSDESIIEITTDGLAQSQSAGEVELTVTILQEDDTVIMNSLIVTVGEATVVSSATIVGTIRTTTFYVLEGTFELLPDGEDLQLNINEDYEASASLPGLYIYLSNNRNSIANAQEIGEVDVFSGAHSYTIEKTGINDFNYIVYFCKPFNVKVGDAKLN